MMNEQVRGMGVGGKLLVLSGSVLIAAAVVVLLFISFLIYQIFYQPDQIYLVKYFMDTIDVSKQAFFGHIDKAPFYIYLSDPIKYFLYLMGIGLILMVVVGILRSILVAGTTLIKVAYASVSPQQE